MTPDEIINKAKSFIGVITKYRMGADHRNTPGVSDCSAFLWLVLGKRKCQNKLWWNTDKIVSDLLGKQTQFVRLSEPEVGCIAVYGRGPKGAGHVAFIVDPLARTIVDCSGSKNGVAVHDGSYFWTRAKVGRAYWARYVGQQPGQDPAGPDPAGGQRPIPPDPV